MLSGLVMRILPAKFKILKVVRLLWGRGGRMDGRRHKGREEDDPDINHQKKGIKHVRTPIP